MERWKDESELSDSADDKEVDNSENAAAVLIPTEAEPDEKESDSERDNYDASEMEESSQPLSDDIEPQMESLIEKETSDEGESRGETDETSQEENTATEATCQESDMDIEMKKIVLDDVGKVVQSAVDHSESESRDTSSDSDDSGTNDDQKIT